MATETTTRVAEMTVGELRAMIQELVQEAVQEAAQKITREIQEAANDILLELGDIAADLDPDEGLEFRPEVAEYLSAVLQKDKLEGVTLEEVKRELGLGEPDE